MKTTFIVASHQARTLTPLPAPFYEVCVVGDNHILQPGYQYYVDGIPGLNIPNSAYSEIPALFSVPKYFPESEIVGFMHYRRLFTAIPDHPSFKTNRSAQGNLASNFENRANMANQLQNRLRIASDEVIIPKALHLSNWTLYSHFSDMHPTLLTAFIFACQTCDEKYGIASGQQSTLEFMQSCNRGFFWNSFISPRKFYDDWCALLYSVFQEMQPLVPSIPIVEGQERWAGYVAERLFTRYVYLMIDQNYWQFTERSMVFLS